MGAPLAPAVAGELLRFVTAGSVDDGKSTLIGRLLHDTQSILADQLAALERASGKRGFDGIDLSLLTDGLEAEREQGITIDVAYRYFATPRRKFIIADAPGHVQYTRNMVTAASTADVAVLLVDARKGVLAQTRRHAYLARWVGIRRIVLAVNKMDLAAYSQPRFEGHRETFLAFAAALGFDEIVAVPMSALAGDMVVGRGTNLDWYDGPTLIDFLNGVPVRRERLDAELRFPVQRVARVPAPRRDAEPLVDLPSGRGYQGTVAAGRVRVGDAVTVLPAGLTTTVQAIVGPRGDATSAGADEAVTLFLAGELDVARGDLIVGAGSAVPARKRITAELCWLSGQAWRPGGGYLLKHTASTVRVAAIELDQRLDVETLAITPHPETLQMNDIARVTISLQRPVHADAYAAVRATGSFILIDASSNDTVAAGVILEHPQPG